MRKTIMKTIDDGICKAWDIQSKAFWPDAERKYWVSWLKSFMAQEAEIKILMQKGDIDIEQLTMRRKNLQTNICNVLCGLSKKNRERYQPQAFCDPRWGTETIRIRLCKVTEKWGCFRDGRFWKPDKVGLFRPLASVGGSRRKQGRGDS